MRIQIEINTAAYDKPFKTYAIYKNSDDSLKLTWNETHEGDKKPTEYVVEVDKVKRFATVKRTGGISSAMVFDTATKTKGIFYTPYGNIEMTIKTEYINLPSVMSPVLEIGYRMDDGAGELTENVFSVKLLLQNG